MNVPIASLRSHQLLASLVAAFLSCPHSSQIILEQILDPVPFPLWTVQEIFPKDGGKTSLQYHRHT